MKIRIFALAKELGLDNKVLIDFCNQAGVQVKSSALASISPEEREVVVGFIKQASTSTKSDAVPDALTPKRDSAVAAGKVRKIKIAGRRASAAPVAEEAGVEAAEGESGEPSVQPVETDVLEPVAEEQSASVGEPATEIAAEPVAQEAESGETEESAANDTNAPISRGDYVPAPGGFATSRIREMKPIGTVGGGGAGDRQSGVPRKPAKPSLPSVAAAPAYKPPTAKKTKTTEAPAQKPDLPLTPDILESKSPLSAHLRKSADKKKGKGKASVGSGRKSDLRGEAQRSKLRADEDRKPKRGRGRSMGGDDERRPRRFGRRRQKSSAPIVLKTSAQLELPTTVRGLSEALGRPAKVLLSILFQSGQMMTINDNIDEEIALELAMEVGVELEIKHPRDAEQELLDSLETIEPEESLQERPPIITILGHVDHGKTTLVDKLRTASVADVAGEEAGGITQHIAAYQVTHKGHRLTFVDTPGHAAFGEMRARGANVTDIIVLVVAADDGVMPQTVECISHAKSAGVPIVVALNKIDLPDVNEQKVLTDLSSHNILPAEWGGDVEVVRTSALNGTGLDDLLETLLVTSELQEYRENPDRPAAGVCLEAFLDEGRGVLAWLIVQKGTLRIGDVVLCGTAFGRIRAIYDDHDNELQEAPPSTPIKVAGLDSVPGAGNHFFVMPEVEEAREIAESRHHLGRTRSLSGKGKPRTLEDILVAARGGSVQELPLIIKADTPGSIEALRGEIEKFEHPEVRVTIVHDGVGGVNESDVYLASASGAIIIAFHVISEDRAAALAEREGVDVRRFNIIYEVTDTIKRSLEGLLEPERVEVPTGRALVLQTFSISRFGTIAGCRVLSGTISRGNRVHVIRDQTVLNDYDIASLKREKDDAKEVRDGMECGIRLDGFNDVKEGDLLESFRVDHVKRTLD